MQITRKECIAPPLSMVSLSMISVTLGQVGLKIFNGNFQK